MAAATVIAFPTLKANPSSPKDMVTDCRQIAASRLTQLVAEMLNTVEDEFFSLAEKAASREEQNLYLDARAQSREQRQLIEAQFRLQFERLFDRRLNKEVVKSEDFD